MLVGIGGNNGITYPVISAVYNINRNTLVYHSEWVRIKYTKWFDVDSGCGLVAIQYILFLD